MAAHQRRETVHARKRVLCVRDGRACERSSRIRI